MKFTKAQEEAIMHNEGPCLVLAVPGSGKTTVLLNRLRQLVKSGVRAENICSITFSKLQAMDMRERFYKDPEMAQYGKVTFSTIHAFCYRILRIYARSKGRNLTLIEGSDQWNKYRILASFFKEARGYSMTEEEAEDFFRIDGYLKNSLITYQEYRQKTKHSFSNFSKISKNYEKFKADHDLIDFDDMLIKSLRVLDLEPQILDKLRKRFPYFQVDEAQDTSPIQFRIIEKLVAPKNNLLMAADDDQAIYGFRGANPYYLLHFKEIYPQAQIIKMEENYRSTGNIVRLASSFIRYNKNRYQKKAEATQEASEKIKMYLVKNLDKEMSLLEKKLEEDLKKGSMAILFRNNLSMIAPSYLLMKKGIPFQSRARSNRFFRHQVLRDALEILNFSQDPSDMETFSHIYYKLNAFIKKTFIQEVSLKEPYLPVLDRLLELPETQNRFYQEKLDRLQQSFDHMRLLRPYQALEEMESRLGYGEYIKENARFNDSAALTAQRVLEILKYLAKDTKNLSELKNSLRALEMEIQNSAKNSSSLTLSTIHGAKGLEYDTVWLIDLLQNEFPSIMALELNDGGDSRLLEEERRLFYVGMTRAKKRLRLVGRRQVNGRPAKASQFLEEIQH